MPGRAMFEVLTHDSKGLRKRIPELFFFQKFCPSICQSVHLPINGCHRRGRHSPGSRDELATA